MSSKFIHVSGLSSLVVHSMQTLHFVHLFYLFICPWIPRLLLHFICFYDAAMNIDIQISVPITDFNCLCISPEIRCWIRWQLYFTFFKEPLHCLFYDSCTILYSHQLCTGVPISPHPHQHLLLPVFFFFSFSLPTPGGTRIWIQVLTLARQTLYHLSLDTSPFFSW
jgi:hypothetical protein